MLTELEVFRAEIDEVDIILLSALRRRFALARRIGELKAREGIVGHDPKREAFISRLHGEFLDRLGVDVGARADVLMVMGILVASCRRVVELAVRRHDPGDEASTVDPT